MFRYLTFLLVLIASLSLIQAQTDLDALRHTQQTLTGTARSLGMGGAFSAVGADLSAASLNPAGLGVYRGSSFVLSPTLTLISNEGRFLDRQQTASDLTLRNPQMGIAFTTLNYVDDGRVRREVEQGLKSYTFAIGFHDLENYNRNLLVSGAYNPFSSITDAFAERAQGIPFGDLIQEAPFTYEELYFQTFAIDTLLGTGGTEYFPAVNDGRIEQTVQLQESGRRSEWYAALGANFSDRFYVGASLNLQFVRYQQAFNFNERDVDNLHTFYESDPNGIFPLEFPMNSIRFSEEFNTRGNGISGQVGIIARPIDQLRIAISAKTPTYLNLTDNISRTELSHEFNVDEFSVAELSEDLPAAEYSYILTTPFRATAGLMFLVGKAGFITADAEWVDYGNSSFSSGATSINDPNFFDYSLTNSRIANQYRPVFNLRLGGEARVDMLRLRAGFAYYPSPFTEEGAQYLEFTDAPSDFRDLIGQDPANLVEVTEIDANRIFLTFGLGIRQPNWFADVSLVNQRQNDKFSPYSVESNDIYQPVAVNRISNNQARISIGFNF